MASRYSAPVSSVTSLTSITATLMLSPCVSDFVDVLKEKMVKLAHIVAFFL